jgi:hypothetical protein
MWRYLVWVGFLGLSLSSKAVCQPPSGTPPARVDLFGDALPAGVLSRSVRTVAVLEHAGTSAARQHLAKLAAGAPAAWLTQEARSSLERLSRRTAS